MRSIPWLPALVLALGHAIAHAQTPPSRLPQDTPREPQPAATAVPLSIPKDLLTTEVPAGAESIRLRLNAVELTGNTAIPTGQLQAIWAGDLGKEVSLSRVFAIAESITAEYRNAGYVLSQAVVMQQQISQADGRVRLGLLEGRISAITVTGVADAAKAKIEAILAPIALETPLTQATLERRLLLLNDLPGVSARANLKAGSTPGAAEMEVQVAQDRGSGSVAVHNRTSEAVGPTRIELSGEGRGLMGSFDRHALRVVSSGNERLTLVGYSGEAPLLNDGFQVGWSLSGSRSKPKSGAIFQLDTKSTSGGLSASYPMVRSRLTNAGLRMALSAYNGKTDIAAGLPLSEDKLRIVRLGLSADHLDGLNGINLFDLEASKGLSGMGASKPGDPMLQRAGSNPQFSKATLYVARLQSLGGTWSLLLAGTAQTSSDLLSSSEQFGLGGEVFLRAYDPSEFLGDSGSAGKIELRVGTALGALNLTLYGYFDGGRVTLRSASGPDRSTSAQSAGLGIRFGLRQGLKGFIEVAKPRKQPTAAEGNFDPRAFGGVAIDF